MSTLPCGHTANYKNIIYRNGGKHCRTCRLAALDAEKSQRAANRILVHGLRDQGYGNKEVAWKTGLSINVVAKLTEDYVSPLRRKLMADPTFATRAIKVAAQEAGASVDQLKMDWRHKEMVRARHAFTLALHERGFSSARIGQILSRDHTTILNNLKTAKRLVGNDPHFTEVFARVNAA